MAKAIQIQPEEARARAYADRLILQKLTELQSVVKLSEIAEDLSKDGLTLGSIRALLASNEEKFAYHERRWVPAARIEGAGRPVLECVRLIVDRFGGPMPIELVVREVCLLRGGVESEVEAQVMRLANSAPELFITENLEVCLRSWTFAATDESTDAAYTKFGVKAEDVAALAAKLEGVNWLAKGSVQEALKKTGAVNVKALGAVVWQSQNSQDPRAHLFYNWREFSVALFSTDGFVHGSDGVLYPLEDAKKWISTAVKLADRIAPTVEIEDVQPIEVKAADVERIVKKIVGSEDSVPATQLLEEFYEITPSVKTFPDDLENLKKALVDHGGVWWVGGDRFRKPKTAPDFIYSVPEVFDFEESDITDEDGDYVDSEITDEGLSTTLRKLLNHPLATDVLDEEILPAPKQQPETLRLVLRTIHREIGTFPMSQIPTGWMDDQPGIQELIFVDPAGREAQVWLNSDARLMFGLLEWFFEQPVESGAVFTLSKTHKPNVFNFSWLEQTDPVVFISNQRMEELRTIQAEAEGKSTLQLLQEVMSHWPKGADFLTILWELNVVRRTRRRLVASLLTNYHSFYQRSGSPVWHFDAKKVEQGFDKTKKKFLIKR
ncbi:MAG: hypothetical protein JNJ45_04845 [Chthonomonas sp.]|nr:hypothetical protein [Chthonomonas sp.]